MTTQSTGILAPCEAAREDDLPRPHGRYLLLRRIARGGMGEVFLASTTGVEGAERPVVVKIIRREHVKDPSFIARFLDEARVQAQLQHSGVAQVLEATVDDTSGEPYAVIEHVEGRSLGDVRGRAVQLGERIGWIEAVAIATLIAEALAHVHEREDASGKPLAIVHRDLSPQNVMLSYSGEAKIIDFGTARGQNRRCHTVAGVVFAKPGYVAPEVANGDPGDFRVDLYALGIMLWELCMGRRFLQGDAAEHLASVARNANNPPPIAETVGAPADLDVVIATLTAFDRDARYSAGRLAACELARVLADAPALPSGERGMRARVTGLMRRLFPSEPGKSRRDFARLVAAARANGPLPMRSRTPTLSGADQISVAAPTSPAPLPVPEVPDQLPGTRYRLGREIGRGASSVVYEAEHLDLRRHVALKLLDGAGARGKAFLERFHAEARAVCRLRHPNLVDIIDVGVAEDGRPFCAMELLEGETLEHRISRGPIELREALGIALDVLKALDVAHAAGLVHRDIKPANLFLPLGGGVRLLDFGLVQEFNLVRDDARAKDAMSLFGTPEYMAPEQAIGARLDGRADIYALGCVLYEMLTSRLPFVGPSPIAILDAKTKGSPDRLCERAPALAIPDVVDELVMRAIARHPSLRFQSASEMRLAVEAALDQPLRSRALRRVGGFSALAASMAFAAVLIAGAARGHSPWLARFIPSASPAHDELAAQPSAASNTSNEANAAPAEPAAADDDADDPSEDGAEPGETAFIDPGAPAPVTGHGPPSRHTGVTAARAAHHSRERAHVGSRPEQAAASAAPAAPAPSAAPRPSSAPSAAPADRADRADGARRDAPAAGETPPDAKRAAGDAPKQPAADATAAPDVSAPLPPPGPGGDAAGAPKDDAPPPDAEPSAAEAKRGGASRPRPPPKADGVTPVRHKKRSRVAHKPE